MAATHIRIYHTTAKIIVYTSA